MENGDQFFLYAKDGRGAVSLLAAGVSERVGGDLATVEAQLLLCADDAGRVVLGSKTDHVLNVKKIVDCRSCWLGEGKPDNGNMKYSIKQ